MVIYPTRNPWFRGIKAAGASPFGRTDINKLMNLTFRDLRIRRFCRFNTIKMEKEPCQRIRRFCRFNTMKKEKTLSEDKKILSF